jgi:hypothetical protein
MGNQKLLVESSQAAARRKNRAILWDLAPPLQAQRGTVLYSTGSVAAELGGSGYIR